ncbi:hypothetical protein APY04_1315 [Hyphomicrobium sulfonivorans]|uniref:Uncharacterized protein n=1 Tax=Hyphomicrobium sulfonivorans TaxID=121290 RepID=A0A109BJW1_HYPSL|nr:hypothetical protein [Hyphomicrobium sulfonivorans]KWT69815.1 hypothetical protein APY04_1315 [Hyphomicrobium sulfonivorans]
MTLVPYAGSSAPASASVAELRPRPKSYVSRIWRHGPNDGVPLFRIDTAIDPATIEDRALSAALAPFAPQLQDLSIYVLHAEEVKPLAPWAVGRLDVDEKSAHVFLHDYLAAPNGMLMLNLFQAPGAVADIVMGVAPMVVELPRIHFAITDYDIGIRASIG